MQLHSLEYREWTSLDADDVMALLRAEAALDG
jgi:hypothetical protein